MGLRTFQTVREPGLILGAEKRASKNFDEFCCLVISGFEQFSTPSPNRRGYYTSPITTEIAELIGYLEDRYKSMVLIVQGKKGRALFQEVYPLGLNLREKRFEVEYLEIEEPGQSRLFNGFEDS